MYYYPYYLQFTNMLSFRHYNSIDENEFSNISSSNKEVELWSISRWSYSRFKGTTTFTASYNYYTKNYIFDGKRYISYDDVVNKALTIK